MVVELTSDNVEEFLKQDKALVLYFWAVWCGPCKVLAPVIEALSDDYEEKVVMGKVDIDNERKLTEQYSIRSVPTTLFIIDGRVVEQMVGSVTKSTFERKLQMFL